MRRGVSKGERPGVCGDGRKEGEKVTSLVVIKCSDCAKEKDNDSKKTSRQ